jgi:rubrerythrin
MEKMRSHTGNAEVCSLDDMEAFKLAMEMEREDYEFYKELAELAAIDEEKALFEKLAREEEKQYEVLSETHSFLTDSGNWFMWDEHSIVEG